MMRRIISKLKEVQRLWLLIMIREDLNWTEKMLLRKLMDQKQHELDSLDFEIEAAQRRVHLEAGE